MAKRSRGGVLKSLLPPPQFKALLAIVVGAVVLTGLLYFTGLYTLIGAQFFSGHTPSASSHPRVSPGQHYSYYGGPRYSSSNNAGIIRAEAVQICETQGHFVTPTPENRSGYAPPRCWEFPDDHNDGRGSLTIPADINTNSTAHIRIIESYPRYPQRPRRANTIATVFVVPVRTLGQPSPGVGSPPSPPTGSMAPPTGDPYTVRRGGAINLSLADLRGTHPLTISGVRGCSTVNLGYSCQNMQFYRAPNGVTIPIPASYLPGVSHINIEVKDANGVTVFTRRYFIVP